MREQFRLDSPQQFRFHSPQRFSSPQRFRFSNLSGLALLNTPGSVRLTQVVWLTSTIRLTLATQLGSARLTFVDGLTLFFIQLSLVIDYCTLSYFIKKLSTFLFVYKRHLIFHLWTCVSYYFDRVEELFLVVLPRLWALVNFVILYLVVDK